jgi:hypothetical protein
MREFWVLCILSLQANSSSDSKDAVPQYHTNGSVWMYAVTVRRQKLPRRQKASLTTVTNSYSTPSAPSPLNSHYGMSNAFSALGRLGWESSIDIRLNVPKQGEKAHPRPL